MSTTSGALIKERRKQMGLSQLELAKKVGVHQQTVNKIEQGRIKFSRHLLPIQKVLGMLEGAEGTGGTAVFLSHHADDSIAVGTELRLFYCDRSIPEDLDAMVLPAETKATIPRPHHLLVFEDAYAVVISVSAMAPAYEVGDTVYVNPTLPAEQNKDVLLRKELGAGGAMVVIAHLVENTRDGWRVCQHNRTKKVRGEETNVFTIKKEDYPRCHRIIGKLNR